MPAGSQPGERRGGRSKGTKNKRSHGVEEWALELVQDAEYQMKFKERLLSGQLAPALETMVHHYAYGKPTERVEVTGKDGQPLEILYGSRDKKSLL